MVFLSEASGSGQFYSTAIALLLSSLLPLTLRSAASIVMAAFVLGGESSIWFESITLGVLAGTPCVACVVKLWRCSALQKATETLLKTVEA